MAAAAGLQPTQPTATELAQWNAGRNNARNAYLSQLAANTYNMGVAKNNYTANLEQQQYANKMQRQTFDDPYIGRGLYNSGIRAGGLSNMYTQQQYGIANLGRDYANQYGTYQMQNEQALNTRDTALQNYNLMEQARRADLASQIRGVT